MNRFLLICLFVSLLACSKSANDPGTTPVTPTATTPTTAGTGSLGRAKRLAAAAGGEIPPFLTVKDASAVLANAALCVGLDTGFTHIAAAFGVATIGIYCDHEPGLVGITGDAYVASVGDRGVVPSVAAVDAVLVAAWS